MVAAATVFWLVVLVAMIVTELNTMGLTSIWFAGGALVAAILAAFSQPILVQVIAFIVVSLILLVVTRPIAKKYFNQNRVRTNVDSLLGKNAIVTDRIDNLQGRGSVTVNGMEWTARSAQTDGNIAEGKEVVIKGVSGVKLIVEEREKVD